MYLYIGYEVNQWLEITKHSIFYMTEYNLSYNARLFKSNSGEATVNWGKSHKI